jgi:hypothetical protein
MELMVPFGGPYGLEVLQIPAVELVGELAALRMITNLDRAALAADCGAYAF